MYLIYLNKCTIPSKYILPGFDRTLLALCIENFKFNLVDKNISMIQYKLYREYLFPQSTSQLDQHWFMHQTWEISFHMGKWSYKRCTCLECVRIQIRRQNRSSISSLIYWNRMVLHLKILIEINQCAYLKKFTWNLLTRVSKNHFTRASDVYQYKKSST